MFGRNPVLPVDHLINTTKLNWNEDYVQSQSDLICRAQSVAKDSLLKAADADKQRWDRRAKAGPIPVGHRVLLKQCAFTGRHKLSNTYGDTSYVVVNSKTDRHIYEIRPAHGGPSKWVNQKLLIDDPLPRAPAATVELDILHRVDDNDPDENSDDEAYKSSELIAEASPSSTVAANWPTVAKWRRSHLANKGRHSNPAHLPGEAAERLLEAL